MANETEILAWDTCVIIDAIQKSGDWTNIQPFIASAEMGQTKIVISEISVVEVCYLQGLDGKVPSDEQYQLIDAWLESPYLIRRPMHAGITKKAIALARNHRLRACDAIVLATAIHSGAPVLHTGDGSGRKTGGKLIPLSRKVGEPPIIIERPNPSRGTIFEEPKSQE